MKQLALGVRLRADAVFESYWPGTNTEIIAALQAPGTAPLWLWGARGTGKTHLLQAVCAAAGAAAAYFPLDRSLALPPEALAGYERTAVLCVDDADAVAGDLAWERALFHLFNAAAELRTRLIFAAAAPPRQAEWSLEDWRSRAGACVVYQLRELDDEGRIEALRLRAAQRGLQLPYETSEYLLKRMPRDLRSLFEILDQLDEASLAAQRRLTIPFIRDALEKRAGTKP
ncbi:MAG TPA: DnaA regulatory inactivator Hda [Steroidobacteraceae bacterium]|nr:DnaA regulatory inactivator Hda [Steroidobacteraceae bacterium]